jgi:N-acetylglucosaminyl-diphospho-decaprenol L-rhamnosyltransferase
MLDLSVIIVSWNTSDLLHNCLASLFTGGGIDGIAADVWVVDNASTDNSVAMVRAQFPQVKLIETGSNLGFAGANNKALTEATGRHVLLLNSDTIVSAGAFAKLVDILEKHPEVAVIGPMLRNSDGTLQASWARFPNAKSEFFGQPDRSQSPYAVEKLEAGGAGLAPFVCDYVSGACFLVRGDLARKYGYLDEGFFMYFEETEWCYRLKKALPPAGKTLFVPAVSVIHLGGQSSKIVPLATRTRFYRSSVRFYKMVYGPLIGFPAIFVAWVRFVLVRFIVLPLRAKK